MTQKPQLKKKRKWPWVLLCLLLLAGAALYFITRGGVGAGYQAETAEQRDITTNNSFAEHLSPVSDEKQTAKEAVKVKELYVSEGDTVRVGDALLRGADGKQLAAAYAGTVEKLYPGRDDTLQPGAQIARIVDYGALEVSVNVDEYDIGALDVGKSVTVYLNALDRDAEAPVSEIARDATREGGVSYYEVKLTITDTQGLRSGMSVEVRALSAQALQCVSVATKALAYDEYNKPYVLVMDAQGKPLTRYVTLGVSDGLYTEITEGVAEGETIYYIENDMLRFFAMQSGMRSSMQGTSN